MDKHDLSSTKLNEIQNYDDFRVVWVGLDDAPGKLKELLRYVKEYYSDEECINYIKQFKSERKILLILTNVESISNFVSFPQIQSIYVLEKQSNNFNKNNYEKLVNVFDDINELIDRLCKDIVILCKSDLPITISSIKEIINEQSITKLQENTLMFLWNQVFVYYLIDSTNVDMNQLKDEMLKQCRLEYEDDQIELKKIDDFCEKCSDDNILQWYTKDSFLYRLLNRAFRTQNVDSICKFQYFIILLYKKFKNLSKQQHENPFIVYRGQSVNENDLKKLKSNKGRFISMNTILSTSCNEDVARIYATGSENPVIFKINIPKQIYNSFKPFIDISQFSSFPDEREILFFVGTVFSIDNVYKEQDSIWIIETTLYNDLSKHIANLISIFKGYVILFKNMNFSWRPHLVMKTDDFNMIDEYYSILTKKSFPLNATPTLMMYIHIAFTFSNLGLYKQAIQRYEEGLSATGTCVKSPQSIVIHMIIGYLYYHLSEYDNAFHYYAHVLSLLDETNLLTSELYKHIGDVWTAMKNDNIALSCYEKALEVSNNQDFPSLIDICKKIIDILKKQGNFNGIRIYKAQMEEIDQSKYHIQCCQIFRFFQKNSGFSHFFWIFSGFRIFPDFR
jgi:tetratricopeptide (TPR) repeat protein